MAAPEKLSIIVFSGDFERVHFALATAASAAAIDVPVTLFFTMGALRALVGDDGWKRLGPAADGSSPEARDAAHAASGVATFDELISSCIALKVAFVTCEMGMAAMGLAPEDLRAGLSVRGGGMVSLLRTAGRHGSIVFI
jgi:peroxiredoxin family protein